MFDPPSLPPGASFPFSAPPLLLLVPLLLQAGRDEGYEVDEDLAEQDASSLFEVRSGAPTTGVDVF